MIHSAIVAGGDSGRTFRAHGRRPARLRVLATHAGASWQRELGVEDIGLGGASFVVEDRIAPGDWLTLSFTAPTLWDPLVLRARVAWIGAGPSGRRAGVAFEHEDASAVFALFELISGLAYE